MTCLVRQLRVSTTCTLGPENRSPNLIARHGSAQWACCNSKRMRLDTRRALTCNSIGVRRCRPLLLGCQTHPSWCRVYVRAARFHVRSASLDAEPAWENVVLTAGTRVSSTRVGRDSADSACSSSRHSRRGCYTSECELCEQ